jgi:O-methyltransferase
MYRAFDVLREGRGQLTAPRSRLEEPLPSPALPWTESLARWTSPSARLRIQMAWERLPRRVDLASPGNYVKGLRLHRELFHHGFTMLYPLRGRALYRLAVQASRDDVPGALVDCGIWNGGSTALMAAGAPARDVWAFGSFQEAARSIDECHGPEHMLRDAVGRFVPEERLHVRAGRFEETLPPHAGRIGPIALLHCDCDAYDSVILTLETLYPHVSPRGWIVIDDYGGVPGAGKATRDFRAQVGDASPLVRIDQTGRYWRKPVS